MGSNTNYKQIKIKINILDLYNSYEFVFMFTIDDTDTKHTEYPGCHYRWGEYGGGRSLSLVWGGAEAALMLRLGLLL